MTERKPPQHSFPTWIDQQIAEAERRGVFDDLPGAGKPLPPRQETDFTQAWLRDKLRREGVPAEEMLPTPLRLRREAERLTAGPLTLRSEAEVREAVAELNTRIRHWRANSTDGPPILVPLVKEDRAVAAWHQARAAQRAEAARAAAPVPSPAEAAPDASRRRWRPWRRRR
jgi:pyruvate/2-oxoglutarate dehydrogenase complex dihydrolipoamide acyltransferase (E2) component